MFSGRLTAYSNKKEGLISAMRAAHKLVSIPSLCVNFSVTEQKFYFTSHSSHSGKFGNERQREKCKMFFVKLLFFYFHMHFLGKKPKKRKAVRYVSVNKNRSKKKEKRKMRIRSKKCRSVRNGELDWTKRKLSKIFSSSLQFGRHACN